MNDDFENKVRIALRGRVRCEVAHALEHLFWAEHPAAFRVSVVVAIGTALDTARRSGIGARAPFAGCYSALLEQMALTLAQDETQTGLPRWIAEGSVWLLQLDGRTIASAEPALGSTTNWRWTAREAGGGAVSSDFARLAAEINIFDLEADPLPHIELPLPIIDLGDGEVFDPNRAHLELARHPDTRAEIGEKAWSVLQLYFSAVERQIAMN